MVAIRVEDLDKKTRYTTLISCVIPRPIAWVTTLNENGSVNLAPYSAFNMVCSNPTTVLFSVGFKPGGEIKDTLTNIRREQEFVINIPRTSQLEQVAHSAAPYPYSVSESDMAGTELAASESVRTPRVARAVFSLECSLQQTVQVGDGQPGSATVVFGTVSVYHIADEIYENGRVNFSEADVLSRLGGYCYAPLGDVLEQRVPEVTVPGTRF